MGIGKFGSDEVSLDGLIFAVKVIEKGAKVKRGKHVV